MGRGEKISLDFTGSWGEGWSLETEPKEILPVPIDPSRHQLVFRKEKRKGKPVTLVGPFSLSGDDAQKSLATLKKSLACGGTFKEGWMEFQGDIADKVRVQLEKLGFRFKK